MRPLDLNLATRPYSNNMLVWAAYVALLAAAVFFSYWNISSYRHYRAELEALDLEQGNMDQERIDLTARHGKVLRDVRKYDRVAINRRTTKANEVIEWRAFSWTRLFNRLEEVLPNNIKMTSIRPIFRGRDRETEEADSRPQMPVKVEGLARDWDSLFELETDLIDDPSFGRVLPRNIDKRDNGELAFSIEFTYYPEEPVGAETPAVAEREVAEAAPAEEAAPGDAPGVADSGDTPRKLPPANEQAAEVTDEWAAQSTDEAAADTPAANDRPGRRKLPTVPQDRDDDDGEGE
ncbi:MAG: hypothetical protein GTO30_03995 [Acidobacteria bacterium]|nr:hypothetical protein [Acidobacteriota bacterium]